MSKTDKTRPIWVKLYDPVDNQVREEIHDHRDGVCDFEKNVTNKKLWPIKCGYSVSYYGWNSGFFSRGPTRWLKSEVRIRHGAARAALRRDVRNMLKLNNEDIVDYDVINPRPRNGALWDYH